MTREEILQKELVDDMLQWSSEKMYNTFGSWLETVVIREKDKLQLKIKTIWKNRKRYAFKDTGDQFDNDTMLLYFDIKKLKKYSLSELETIIDKIEDETVYENTI
jgi:hypothetical protein